MNENDDQLRRNKAGQFAVWFALIGIILGVVFGVGGAAVINAAGIDEVDLPPINAPTAATSTPTAEPSATPEPTSSAGEPPPTISASTTRVSPGERFVLTGAFPASPAGDDLQVEVRDQGADWDDFPIQTKTRDGGTFKTELYTSRTGTREFRLTNVTANISTPAVKIEIG